MNYNKNLQKKLNVNIDIYKEYSTKYSSIEIEVKLVDNKHGKFINTTDNEFYHIYFDNSKEEVKRNYLDSKYKNSVNIIKIKIDLKIKSLKGLFDECECISSINFKKFNRTNITDMSGMFSGCSSLEDLNLSNFKTDNVKNMGGMFSGCSSLKELSLSNFKTDNVDYMSGMFSGCSSLKELNLSNFKTDNIKNMSFMFNGCSSLKELNLSNFKTDNVEKNALYVQ